MPRLPLIPGDNGKLRHHPHQILHPQVHLIDHITRIAAQRHATTGAPIAIGSVEKMSKSKKNVVDPDEIVRSYGADTARWFMLSDSPPERDVQWTESGVEGASRFQQRIWRLVNETVELFEQSSGTVSQDGPDAVALRKIIHRTVAGVAQDIEGLGFNRAVARIYELTNSLVKAKESKAATDLAPTLRDGVEKLVQLVNLMMPHLAESCWEVLGKQGLAADALWPEVDPAMLVDDEVTLPIQLNGKRRGEIKIAKDMPPAEVEALVLALEIVQKALDGKAPKKVVVVPNRIVNIVV